MSSDAPLISIGLPVYNGENYLAEAIESILGQDFQDYELILSDNGSSDDTPTICESYAARDGRIRYFRHEKNHGAAWNFNYVVGQSRGRYFKWAAHDDRLRPRFLSECLSMLKAHKDASIAFSEAVVIDESGREVSKYEDEREKLVSDDPLERFEYAVYGEHQFICIFGLIPKELLMKTDLIGAYGSSDVVLLGQLALMGKIIKSKERLFEWRNHGEQSMQKAFKAGDNRAYTQWFDPSQDERLSFAHWKLLFGNLKSLRRLHPNIKQKLKGVLLVLRSRTRISGRRQYLLDCFYAFRCILSRGK